MRMISKINIKEKGITLIALVVTIIVLLILAGVTINIALGNDGLIERAKQTKEEKIVGDEKEQIQLAYTSAKMGTLGAEITERDLNAELTQMLGANEALAKSNGDGSFNVHYNKTGHDYTLNDSGIERYVPEVLQLSEVYGKLYDDGTLILSSTEYTDNSRNITHDFGKVENKTDSNYWSNSSYNTLITKVSFHDKIVPNSTAYYFNNLTNLTSFENMSNLKTGLVTDMKYMFAGCANLTSIDVSHFDTSNVTDMSYMFAGKLDLHTGPPIDTYRYISHLRNLDLSSFDTSNVTTMRNMFENQIMLERINLDYFDTSNVKSMSYMFANCVSLNSLNLNNFNTSNVTNMCSMFDRCISLTELDISSFDTQNVSDMNWMFRGMSIPVQGDDVYYYNGVQRSGTGMSLSKIYVSELWNTDNVSARYFNNTLGYKMFYNCPSLSGAISYDSTKTDLTYANYETGYLTYKSNS